MKRKLLSLTLVAAVFFSLNTQVFADEVIPADGSSPPAEESAEPESVPAEETAPEAKADEAGEVVTDAEPAPAEEVPEPDRPPLVFTVDNNSEGIIINLFDYSPYDVDPLTRDYDFSGQPEGINRNSAKFWFIRENDFFNNSGRRNVYGDDHNWSITNPDRKYMHHYGAYQGLLENELDENGFPVIKETGESMDYLFSTEKTDYPGRVKTYSGTNGLLTKTADGYRYSSDTNYAYFDEETNSFKVYDGTYPAVRDLSHRPINQSVGFFPFNDYDPKNDSIERYLGDGLNHHFGLSISTSFVMSDGGSYMDKPMIFSFSGDDDAWVFIDNHLVMDLGGIHGTVSGDINFQTGTVTVDSVVGKGTVTRGIKDIFAEQNAGWDDSPGAVHTLKFFYLERGDVASNLSINRFNVPTVKDVKVKKTWNDGDNKDGRRPDSVLVRLLAGGMPAKDKNGADLTLTLSRENGWAGTFSYLPVNRVDENNNSVRIDYSVEELNPAGYNSSIISSLSNISENGVSDDFEVINTPVPEKPDKPGNPDEPGVPDKPDKPDEPGVPDKPDNPDKPDVPDKPDIPGVPDKPVNPMHPGHVDNPGHIDTHAQPSKDPSVTKANASSPIPKTGDESDMFVWIGMLAAAAACASVMHGIKQARKFK